MNYSRPTLKGLDCKSTYQKTTQNGTPPVARLQQKVARLEISLRDKDSELAKMNESTKATLVNELRIQTEMYYQEVLRLRNQLNILQETHVQQKICTIQAVSESKNGHGQPPKVKNELVCKKEEQLKESVERLKDENSKLSQKLSSIQADKDKISQDFQTALKKAEKKVIKKTSIVMEEATQTSPKHKSLIAISSTPQLLVPTEDSINILKSQIEELQGREKAWEEERASFKEIVVNLQEDRSFYKDVSLQKHDELGSLQKEMMNLHRDVILLQKDIGVFSENSKPVCSQCTKSSFQNTKSSKNLINESNISSHRSGGLVKNKSKSLMRSSKSLPLGQKNKIISTSRIHSEASLASPIHVKSGKISDKSSKNIRRNNVYSSASSSCSNSVHTSPKHTELTESIKQTSSPSHILQKSSAVPSVESSCQSSPTHGGTPVSTSVMDSLIRDVHNKSKSLSASSRSSVRPSSSQSHVASPSLPHISNSNSSSLLKSTKSLVISNCKSSHLPGSKSSTQDQQQMKKPNNLTLKNSSVSSPSSSTAPLSPKAIPSVNKSNSVSKSHISKSLSPKNSPSKMHQPITKSSMHQKHLKSSKLSAKSILSTTSSSTLEKIDSLDRDIEDNCVYDVQDEEIANEILKSLVDTENIGDLGVTFCSMNDKSGSQLTSKSHSSDHKLIRSQSSKLSKSASFKSESPKKKNSPSLPAEPVKEKHELQEKLIEILESHIVRKSKLKEWKPRQKSVLSPQRKTPTKKKETDKKSLLSTDQSQETENEIEEMISLLEGHVTRKAFLELVKEDIVRSSH